MNLFKNLKIRSLLVLAFIALGTLPLLVLGVFSYHQSKNAIREKADVYVRQMVKQAVLNLNAIIAEIDGNALTLMSDPEFSALLTNKAGAGDIERFKNNARIEQRLYNLGASNQRIRSINFITNDGTLLMSGDELPIKAQILGDGVSGGEADGADQNDDRTRGWLFRPELSDRIYVVREIKNAYTEELLGTLVLELERYIFNDIYTGLPLIDAFDFFLVDEHKTIVSHRDPKLIGNTAADYDPEAFIVIHQTCDNQWQAVAVVPLSYLVADAKNVRAWFLGIGLLCGVLAVLFGVVIAFSLTQPLDDIVSQMKRAEAGHLQTEVAPSPINEIAQVSARFNSMMDSINALNTRLIEEKRETEAANRELSDLRHLLGNILDSMPSIIVGVDRHCRVTQWNRETTKASGIEPQDALQRPLEEVFAALSPHVATIKEAIHLRRLREVKKISWEAAGEIRIFDLMAVPLVLDEDGGAVVRIDDITDRVRFEEMMIQNEKMLSVGGLAAGMAHEINNPLAGMMQNASLLANRLLSSELPTNRRTAEAVGLSIDALQAYMKKRRIAESLALLTESGQRLAEIVSNMLSFARKSDGVTSSYDPQRLVAEALRLAETDYHLKKQFDFKTIKIRQEIEAELPMVPCEASKIQQVLLNIFSNGAQAMQEKKQRDPQYEPEFLLRLAQERRPPMLRIDISDNGPGMAEAIKKRAFEPFFTTKPAGIGTGLGLSVSYFIVTEDHGGTMDVRSKLGHGTTFIIRLPMDRQPPDPGT